MSWILEEMVLDEDATLDRDPRHEAMTVGRPGVSSPAVVVASAWIDLLDGFREPRAIVDAVIEFSARRDLDPEATLDAALPVLERLLAAGLLRPARPRGVPSPSASARRLAASRDFVDAAIRRSEPGAAPGGPPQAGLTFGSAGVAYGLWHMARALGERTLVDEAELRLRRAGDTAAGGSGPVSPYHSPTGLFAVRALVRHSLGDAARRDEAVSAFVAAAREPCGQYDLVLGQAGVLLGVSLLAEAFGAETPGVLLGLGREKAGWVRDRLAPLAPIREDRSIAHLGIAHGWGGILYALLAWAKATGGGLAAAAEGRLAELAELGERSGRGLRWRRTLGSEEPPRYLPSWCNGAAGLLHLWLLAHRLSGEDRYLKLAEGCAWNAWEDGDGSIGHLCCGLSGRAYGLAAFYQATGETAWLDRARRLAAAAMAAGSAPGSAHSLYKGTLGTAVLLADLEEPASASMPFFGLG